MLHRFFIPPDWLEEALVTLRDEPARQIRTVLRMKPGQRIIVLDNSGTEREVELTAVKKGEVQGQIIRQTPVHGEPEIYLTLYQGTLKGQKFEWVLQKGTELGVSRFAPTLCTRSITNKGEPFEKKRTRWERIIREAAEQSQRGKLPKLANATPLAQALEQARTTPLILMPWERAAGEPSLKTILSGQQVKQAAIFIGPEGGFTSAEAALAKAAGAHLVKLGPRILRAETAGLAICAALLYDLGAWE